MSKFDLTPVNDLVARYNAAGLGNTWNGQFLSSILRGGVAPRGRGVDLLNKILGTSPEMIKQSIDSLTSLASAAGHDGGWLISRADSVRKGWDLSESDNKRIEAIREKIAVGSMRKATPAEKDLFSMLFRVKNTYSPFYWARRGGTAGRLDKMFNHVNADGQITDDDVTWIRSQFKGVLKKIEETEHPIGSLRTYIDPYSVKSIVMIVSVPRLGDGFTIGDGFTTNVVVDAVCNGISKVIPVDRLAKRFGKIDNNA